MGVGRYFCVALPFILTVASIIAALIVGLTGVSSNDLYLFRIDVTNLSINVAQLSDFVNNASSLVSDTSLDNLTDEVKQDVSDKVDDIVSRSPIQFNPSIFSARDSVTDEASDLLNSLGDSSSGENITASTLGLANKYDFTLWGYCVLPQNGTKNCTKAEFDWATHKLNLTWLEQFNSQASRLTGLNITLPKELNDGLNVYKTITKWTEVVFIIAIIALALELIVGLFTACSRAVSCVTWIISGFATAAIIATAILLTVTGSIVIGLILGVGKKYGVKADLNTSFLAVTWLSVAFAIGAGLFWLFTICCCKPENRPHARRSRHADTEKLAPHGSYAPLGDNRNSGYGNYNYPAAQRGGARSDLAYEPYSHSRV
ncbi:SUR7 protein [Xylaria venustula]|nr:SUR7 protein [Xylaria venustula]